MKKDNNCPNKHEFHSLSFEYNQTAYLKKICDKCGFIYTECETGLNADIYDSGHYEVKNFKLVPFIINLPDYLYYILIIKFKGYNRASSILDFGCGKGLFLYLLNFFGFKNLQGLETSKNRAEFSRKLTGLNITEIYYEGGEILDKKYDFISLIHVLEHINEPFTFLDKLIEGACENEGAIFIEVPNIQSFSSIIAKNSWAHFTPHFHTNHFTISSFINYCIDRNLSYSLVSVFSFYHSAMGMTSALLSIFGYKGSIYEDLKRKNLFIIFIFLFFLPASIFIEFLISVFTKKGTVIKFIIYK
jgi:2-polyprenyl-3-methyl-5-hydroxy-6-metoxy-1,4-benzoquinol methylase